NDGSARRSHRRGKLLRTIALVHVDDGLHGRRELVHIGNVGEIALRRTAERLRRNSIQQDQTEIAVRPSGCFAGVELLPSKRENRVGIRSRYLPFGDDVRMLAYKRQSFIGMRSQREEQ